MTKRTGPTDPNLRMLLAKLEKTARKNKAAIWADVAEALGTPTRNRTIVNLYEIDKNAFKEKVIVPGKVLGTGKITKPVEVAAWSFSGSAKAKIEEAGGKAFGINEIIEKWQGKDVMLMK